MDGLIFAVEEFALFDGPGIRTAVFLKGCPLRCEWCHNPEGLNPQPELVVIASRCSRCGACSDVCKSQSACTACGQCVSACRLNLRRLCGTRIGAGALASRVLRNADILASSGGGLTLSGGEPLAQASFVSEFLASLGGQLHVALESSGYAPPETFREVVEQVDLVLFDIKHTDPAVHRRVTGVENAPILANLAWLKASRRPFWARLPLIPGINDTLENMEEVARLLAEAPGLERVELLLYNPLTGAKYGPMGREYRPSFDVARPPSAHREPFAKLGVECVLA